MTYKILVVDDQEFAAYATKQLLEQNGFKVEIATSGDSAIAKVKSAPTDYGLVILDYQMPEKDGATTARELLSITKELFILIHSGDETRMALRNTWNAGAVEFIDKTSNSAKFVSTVKEWAAKYEDQILKPRIPKNLCEREKLIRSIGLWGRSSALAKIAEKVKHHENEDQLTVLITGASGTGKGEIARAFHLNSPRKNKPFITVNCGAIPENLIESTLFGHEKGSFTGAINAYCGKFKEADGGTLFLDEIGEASLATQVKLLRAIQDGIVTPVGGKDIRVNVRIIAATNRELQRCVAEKTFREDLYYRIKVIEVVVPSLKERVEDIEPIVLSVSADQNLKRGTTKVFLKSTIRALEKYAWPGNVRELENTVLATMAESITDTISPANLPQSFINIVKNEAAKQSTFREYIELVQKEYLEQILSDSNSYNEAAKKAGLPASTLRDLARRHNLGTDPGNGSFKGPKS